jgi:hypothetical protein
MKKILMFFVSSLLFFKVAFGETVNLDPEKTAAKDMTVRQYFVAQVAKSVLADAPLYRPLFSETAAKITVEIADAILNEEIRTRTENALKIQEEEKEKRK